MAESYQRVKYGAAAHADLTGKLPNAFPRTMGPNAMKYLQEVVDSGLTVDMIGRFEQAFAQAHGVKHCIATPGCTPALSILVSSFPFQPGDEIIVSPVTDYGTVYGIIQHNFIPVFPDTEPSTINMCAETIEPCITDRTRAILCVHKTGIICDMDSINALAAKHGLVVYEDACQAVFGEYKGRIAGTLSLAAGFSFDSEKTMGSDVGGCIITNDDDLAERARFMGHSRGGVAIPGFGRAHIEAGHAYRMPQCTAAISLAQLEIVKPNITQRDKMARYLTNLLREIPGIKPLEIPESTTLYSCWMFGFSIEADAFKCNNGEFAAQIVEEGITGAGTAFYYLMPEALKFLQEKAADKVYPYSMPPASREYRYSKDYYPNANEFLNNFIRWFFTEKYEPEHCEIAAEIIARVADKNRV